AEDAGQFADKRADGRADAAFCRTAAEAWGETIKRDAVKKPIMVYVYGGDPHGMADSIEKWIEANDPKKSEDADPDAVPPGVLGMGYGDRRAAARVLARACVKAIEQLVPRVYAAREWLRDVADACTDAGQPIGWVSPSGFPTIQKRIKQKSVDEKVTTPNGRVQYKVRKDVEPLKLDKKEQRNGVAPNFTHSHDAAHLCEVVNAFWQDGPDPATCGRTRHVLHIHDALGCHAANMNTLHRLIREKFVAIYTERDPLPDLVEQTEAMGGDHPPTLPDLPERGSYDIRDAEGAIYLFS
ncbi:MAG: DNA-directed RNA polymerase, partial [Planctomycetota bacterium]